MNNVEFRTIVDSIKEKTDIVQLIGQHVKLNGHGVGHCPFPDHEDKHPSFSVNTKGQYFNCFSCHKAGDVIRFLELYENKPFMQVLSELANRVGTPLKEITEEQKEEIKRVRTIEDILAETATFYHGQFTSEAQEYLKQRNITDETISQFQIGFAQGGLREFLSEKKIPLELCLQAGVLKKDINGAIKDFFYNRVVFPNIQHGRIVHLTGRLLDDTDKTEPKYKHLPIEIDYLFNEDALSEKEVFPVEGIVDALALIQQGRAAVGLYGTALRSEFVSKFSRCERVYLMLDGDEAGRKATIAIGKQLGLKAKAIILPEDEDPDTYVASHTKEEFDILVANAKDSIKYQLDSIPTDTQKLELPQKLADVLQQLSLLEKVYVEAYLEEIKSRFQYLKKEDIDGYRELVTKYRKELETKQNRKTELDTYGSDNLQDVDVARVVSFRDENTIYEEIYNPKKSPAFQFVKLTIATRKYAYTNSFESGNKWYVPEDSEDVEKENLHLPTDVEFISEDKLNREIENFIQDNYWQSTKALFFCRCYIKYTWIYDLFSVVPYLRNLGPSGTGKTRWSQTVGILCNKPMFTAGGITESALYRSTDLYAPTMIINEFDTLGSDDKSRYTTILNNGYQSGYPIRLTEGEGNNRRPRSYEVYCPKIFTTLEYFQSSALESRIINLTSEEFPTHLRNNYSVDLTEQQIERARQIRNKLLGYRLLYIANHVRATLRVNSVPTDLNGSQNQGYANHASQLLQSEPVLDPILDKLQKVCGETLPPFPHAAWKFFEEKEFESRTRQTFYRLLYVMSSPEEIEHFIIYVKQHQKELVKKRSDDLEGKLAQIILNNFEKYVEDITVKGIGHLSVAEITNQLNAEEASSKPLKNQKIGYILRRLRINTSEKDHSNKKYLSLTSQNIEFLYERYIPTDSSLLAIKDMWLARLARVQNSEPVEQLSHEDDSQSDSQDTRSKINPISREITDSSDLPMLEQKESNSYINNEEARENTVTQPSILPATSPWAQYFPNRPIADYSDGQLEGAFLILTDYSPEIAKALGGQEAYTSLLEDVQVETKRRKFSDEKNDI